MLYSRETANIVYKFLFKPQISLWGPSGNLVIQICCADVVSIVYNEMMYGPAHQN